jgi:muramoyltetrapeptide carboxypeptidase
MNKTIPFLKKGDKIALVSPAKAIEPELVLKAKDFWEKHGFIVEIGKHALESENYFSASIENRLYDFQDAIDDDEVRAIVCNRGGYGSIQLLDRLNWSNFYRNPKWIIGFSDITVFHQHLQHFDYESIHATMPLNYSENSIKALESLISALTGGKLVYEIPSSKFNKIGEASGKLIGGNLSVLYGLIGTDSQADYTDSILFIEDLSEQLYHIDRMFYALSKAGILSKVKGLIVGGMTNLKDTEIPYGKSYQEIILDHFLYRNIPIVFDFPAGHINDNRALILSREIKLFANEHQSQLIFFNN